MLKRSINLRVPELCRYLKPTKNYGGFLTSYELNRDKFKSTNKGIAIRKKGPYEI